MLFSPQILVRRPPKIVTGGGALGLQTNLGSFFSLDNTLADATGAVTNLTNNNTVTFVSPPASLPAVTNCANFVAASSQYLSHADATGINVAGIDFSIQFWYYSTVNGDFFLCKSDGSFGNREYQFQHPFGTGGSNPVNIAINSSGVVCTTANTANSAWHHCVATFNNTSKATIIYIDGASAATGTAGASAVGTSNLQIGASSGIGNFINGNMALVGTWRSRILSAGDVTLLYNSGAGLSYAAMA